MKNTDYALFWGRLASLANKGLVISIEEMIEGSDLTSRQRKDSTRFLEFAKIKYKEINGVEFDESSDIG